MQQAELKSLVWYDPATGVFRWRNAMANNRIKPWSIAGATRREQEHNLEYTVIKINGKTYSAHRLAFLYMDGLDPADNWLPDHIDGVGTNNAWSNLRLSNHTLNNQNKKMLRNNTSGYMGVVPSKAAGRWMARIKHGDKPIHIGTFSSIEEAANAYEAKRKELFAHNTGRHLQ